jgi:hypothetical protein
LVDSILERSAIVSPVRGLIAHEALRARAWEVIATVARDFGWRGEIAAQGGDEGAEKVRGMGGCMNRERCLSMEEIAAMGEAIAETAAIIDVATHRFLTQLREFDAVDGWHRAGALSCAHWLSWRVGMDLGAAREKVRVAKKLGELPAIDAALRKGEISYSKVRAMTRVATADSEEQLLAMARSATGAQLEKICRLKRMVNGLGREAREVEARRYVVERATEDGMVSIQLRLLPDEAARVMKAMEVAGNGNRADGVVALAEMALAGGAREGSVRPQVEVLLHVQASDLDGRTELGDGVSAD